MSRALILDSEGKDVTPQCVYADGTLCESMLLVQELKEKVNDLTRERDALIYAVELISQDGN